MSSEEILELMQIEINEIKSTLTSGQLDFVNQAMEGKSIFLQGKAGTGKTHALSAFKKIIEIKNSYSNQFGYNKKRYVTCAPTGIAAINADGSTVHSMFSLPLYDLTDFRKLNFMSSIKREVLQKTDIIIIDEVSMLRCDVLDAMNMTMAKNRIGHLTDKQVIFIGDMKQLPVVANDNDKAILMQNGYEDFSFLGSSVITKIDLTHIELTEVKRQNDLEFIEALNLVREGAKSPYFRQFITNETKGVILCPTNIQVNRHNDAGLQNQDGELHIFEAQYDGICKPTDFNLEKTIRVKVGSPIMYLKNGNETSILRNGTLGTFCIRKSGGYAIKVGSIEYDLQKFDEEKKEYVYNKEIDEIELKVVGSCKQYPFKLAYSISIHKSQGLSFDEATIDLSTKCFADGQLYVALSRVRTPKGLNIITNS